ncbi:MAG: hypothetical protein LQ338_000469 [Usnochroma carphineum]|nr:MAG: hypothetical protein LQ338_000469 [Usnochroma carphineum]
MSFLTSRTLRSIPRSSNPLRPVAINTTRSFHASVRRAALSESDHSQDDYHDRKAKIDHHKDDQLQKQTEGKGHWKKELASNSEAAIKADREEISNVEDDISKLQEQTTEAIAGDKSK